VNARRSYRVPRKMLLARGGRLCATVSAKIRAPKPSPNHLRPANAAALFTKRCAPTMWDRFAERIGGSDDLDVAQTFAAVMPSNRQADSSGAEKAPPTRLGDRIGVTLTRNPGLSLASETEKAVGSQQKRQRLCFGPHAPARLGGRIGGTHQAPTGRAWGAAATFLRRRTFPISNLSTGRSISGSAWCKNPRSPFPFVSGSNVFAAGRARLPSPWTVELACLWLI